MERVNMGKFSKKKRKHSKRYYIAKAQRAVICVLIVILSIMITSISQRVKYEKRIEEINAAHEEDMIALRIELRDDYEAEINSIKQYYEYGGDVTEIEREAQFIAKIMYGVYRPEHNDSHLRAVAWCIFNRVDNPAYPNSVQAVCQQAKQWMGYSDDNPVIAKLYDIALTELKSWHNGVPRPMTADYVYMNWSSREIYLRNTFVEDRNTSYWRMN